MLAEIVSLNLPADKGSSPLPITKSIRCYSIQSRMNSNDTIRSSKGSGL